MGKSLRLTISGDPCDFSDWRDSIMDLKVRTSGLNLPPCRYGRNASDDLSFAGTELLIAL